MPTSQHSFHVAVIGAGAIGKAHAELIARTGGFTLAGIADPSPAAQELAKRLDTAHCSDAGALLDATRLDAAIIATPNTTHLQIARAFLDRRIPLIVEKPIASTLADATALTAAADAAGVPVLIGHHRRHNPIIRRAREIVTSGALGRLTTATVLYTFFKPPGYFDLEWRRQPGGGPVLINLIHEIDLIRFVCGEVASVQAVTSNAVRKFDVEDTAAILLRLENGALVTLSLSDTAVTPWSWDLAAREGAGFPPQPGHVTSHYLSGTEGSLTLPALEHWRYSGEKSWFAPISRAEIAHERGDPYLEQLLHLRRVVRDGEPPLITPADGTRTLRATLAVAEAAASGGTVWLSIESST